jgi:hypothetical protein
MTSIHALGIIFANMTTAISNQQQLAALATGATSEKGYVETAVHWVVGGISRIVTWITDWACYLFKKIFCCFYKSEASPAATATTAETVSSTTAASTREEPRIYREITADNIALLRDFALLPDDAQRQIYREVGLHPRPVLHDFETAGRNRIRENPQLLRPFLREPAASTTAETQ